LNKIISYYFFHILNFINTSFYTSFYTSFLKKKMLSEHSPSKDSLDLITDAIIKETFLGAGGGSISINLKQESEPTVDSDACCLTDRCFKWWFFHSSFQAPKQSIVEETLINKPNKYACCNLCSDCVELKFKNCCITTSDCMKENCSDCFYNGCQLSCCCFTLVLNSK
jgi:hypothetical protein